MTSSRELPTTYWDLVEAAANSEPSRVVLSDDYGRCLTCAGLHAAALQTAAALAQRGVGAGTVVSWQLPTTLEALVVMIALARLGAVQNPIIPVWRDHEIRYATGQVGSQVFIVPRMWRGFDHGRLAQTLAKEREIAALILDFETVPAPDTLRLPAAGISGLPAVTSAGDSPTWVYYSSGTTAAPKGIRHSDASVIAAAAAVVDIVGIGSRDVNPLMFPVSHIGGAITLATALLTDMQLVLFDEFDAAKTPSAIAAHHPTILGSATPFFAAYISAQQRHGPRKLYPKLRGCTGGGAPISAELGRRVRETLCVPGIANSWGLTEFPIATSPRLDAPAHVLDHTVGAPARGVRVRVVGADERDVPAGAEGELRLKGPQCFLGYIDSTLNADAFDADGWFRSGDQGRIDAAGNIQVTGRIKDVIIRNAENISALEVEQALAAHPSVADVAVIGVPDARTGERVCAVIVPAPGIEAVTVSALVEHCSALGLSRYKCPERVELIDALPRNLIGKVVKTELRTRFR